MMAEISPLTPSSPIVRPRRVESDDKRRGEERQPKRERDETEQQSNGEPAHHIDERV